MLDKSTQYVEEVNNECTGGNGLKTRTRLKAMQKGEEKEGSKEKRGGHHAMERYVLAGTVDDIHTLAVIMHDEPLRRSFIEGG